MTLRCICCSRRRRWRWRYVSWVRARGWVSRTSSRWNTGSANAASRTRISTKASEQVRSGFLPYQITLLVADLHRLILDASSPRPNFLLCWKFGRIIDRHPPLLGLVFPSGKSLNRPLILLSITSLNWPAKWKIFFSSGMWSITEFYVF